MEKITFEYVKNDESNLGCEYRFLNQELFRYERPEYVFIATSSSGIYEAVGRTKKECVDFIEEQRRVFRERQLRNLKRRSNLGIQ